MRPTYKKCEASASSSSSLSLSAFICFCFFYIFFFCGPIVVSGSRLRQLRKAKQRFLKRFLKGLLESVSRGPHLPYPTKQHWHLSLPSLFTPTCNTTCHHFLDPSLSPPLFHLVSPPSFYLAPSHVLKAVFPSFNLSVMSPVLTPPCLSLCCRFFVLRFDFTRPRGCFSCSPLTLFAHFSFSHTVPLCLIVSLLVFFLPSVILRPALSQLFYPRVAAVHEK